MIRALTARPRALLLAALAGLAYLPLLLTAPRQISADTKTYLYINPGRLLERATSMWDPNIAMGYVPHQNIGYLWPMGPWYWTFDALGVPDWIAQRLWWGSLLFAAGAGVVALLRRLGWGTPAISVAALVYMLTPYVLTLIARLSGILMPYAALPWLVLLTMLAVRSRGWRHPALFALIAATAGAMNLTALILVGVAPILWLLYEVVSTGALRARDALVVAARLGGLTLLVSAWWLAGLAVQAGYGNDVLRYSESAEAVAITSTANEALRGLGYWFFYGEDRLGPWIEPSVTYTQSLWLLAVSYLLPTLGVVGASLARWRHRTYFIALAVAGLIIGIGPYPFDHPPPLGRAIRWLLLTERGLAMRSLPRAVPLLVLGLAVLLGAGVSAVGRRWPRWAAGAAAGVVVLVLAGQPTILTGDTVPQNLRRSEDVPEYWEDAAARLDAGDHATRALEVPGSDFAAYRWGNTVDPITPGLVERDMAYRELIPFGPPESSAMLDAFDLPLQEGVMSPAAIAPIARLLRVGDVLARNDLAYERFNTPRPKNLWALLTSAPGLGTPEGFGPTTPNRPVVQASLDDELWLLTDATLADPPAVGILPVDDPISMLSAHSTGTPVVVAGDAYSLVDVAAAGLIDGDELVQLSASLDDEQLEAASADEAVLVITDGNRRRGQRWQTIRHTKGYTEPAGLEPLRVDHSDNRLPILGEQGDDGRTVAVHRGGITANATSYGNPITFEPASRPAAAIDGDPRTAWRAAGFSDARGERLQIRLDDATFTDRVRLLQPVTGPVNRHITKVELRFDGGDPLTVDLDEASWSEPGQLVTFDERTFSTLDVEVVADDAGVRPRYAGLSGVGFAEVGIGDGEAPTVQEWIRPPVDLLDRLGAAGADAPLAIVLTRLRQEPTDATRDDEERSIARLLDLPSARALTLSGTARVSARADDATLDALLRPSGPVQVRSFGRLNGSRAQVGAAALDGDLATAWVSPRGAPVGSGLSISSPTPLTVDRLDLAVVADGRHSVPTQLEISADGGPATVVDLPAIRDVDTPDEATTVAVTLPAPVTGKDVRVVVSDVRAETVVDWNSRQPVDHPVAIAELGIPGVQVQPLPATFDSGCRTDLLEVDGNPVGVRVTGEMAAALAGSPLTVAPCTGGTVPLTAGENQLRTAPGADIGVDLDQLVLRSDPGPLVAADADAGAAPQLRVLKTDADAHEVEVTGEPGGEAWLVFGQSLNPGWSATVRGGDDLGAPQLVDGFANGWRVPLDGDGKAVVDLRFGPQRGVKVALFASLAAALLCLVLAWRGRPAPPERSTEPEPLSLGAAVHYDGVRPRRRTAWVATAVVIVLLLLIVPPALALLLGAATLAACRVERARAVLLVVSPLLTLAAGTYVVVQQARHGIPPGTEWPAEQARAHLVALAGVLLLGLDAVVAGLWQPRPRTRPAG